MAEDSTIPPERPSASRDDESVGSSGTQLAYWSESIDQMLAKLQSSRNGLIQAEAERRFREIGPNTIQISQSASALRLLLGQFRSPLVLILLIAAGISAATGEWPDAVIVLTVVLGSTTLGFVQEFRANHAVEKLQSGMRLSSVVVRGGQCSSIPSAHIVPGDVVVLSAGSLIPADAVILEADDLFVNQAVLTGEVFPAEKRCGISDANASLMDRANCVFMGTSVWSGTARVLIVQTATATVFGAIAQRLRLRPEETEFERGARQFGYLLTRIMLVIVITVMMINAIRARPVMDSLLFALALAVGLTPELLPAIVSITMAHGSQSMAKRGVIVRRLNAMENLGSMDVLCTDKTGTLTEGVVLLRDTFDTRGQPSSDVFHLAWLNAHYQTGLSNALDDAIRSRTSPADTERDVEQKVDEVPYDFVRKRLSVVVSDRQGSRTLITKGALQNVVESCTDVIDFGRVVRLDDQHLHQIQELYRQWSAQGYRVLGVAKKPIENRSGSYCREDEDGLQFAGFLLFDDPPKADVSDVISDLESRGVRLSIITGDNRLVAAHVAKLVNLQSAGLLTGQDLNGMSDEALWHAAERTSIFAEVDPHQKERIIQAMRKTGHVVGYLGDGINDAPALHAADVGISVDTAVDVAKEAADLVLLKHDLGILRDGIDEGRRTFANTLKYILTTISANFGNMVSMALATVFLPFLPLLASQILLNNFLSDIPGMAIAGDRVDPEWIQRPRRWDQKIIVRYMVLFGLVSSVFDLLTFGILLLIFRATEPEFRTGWFIESLLTELVIALVVRTRRPFFRSQPGTLLLVSTSAIIVVTLLLPYLPFRSLFGFVPLSFPLMLVLVGLTIAYIVAAEFTKRYFYSSRKPGDRLRAAQRW